VYRLLVFSFLCIMQNISFSQSIAEIYRDKIGSGEILKHIILPINKINVSDSLNCMPVAIYFNHEPSYSEILSLQGNGIECEKDNWTPPTPKHPYGFLVALIPFYKLTDLIKNPDIVRLDVAGAMSQPQNEGLLKVSGVLKARSLGLKGKGVKIAVLDTGLDCMSYNPELPDNYEIIDYSNPSCPDRSVGNSVSGHGTHVTGIIFSKGKLSSSNIANGSGPYEGIAPEAGLIFIKIGTDGSALARPDAILKALDAAVKIYHADIINLSYGSWDIYHDGSSALDQKIDWCYNNGAAVFVAAGNMADKKRHFLGTVSAGSFSDFIKVIAPESNSENISFNLVWRGTQNKNCLSISYYDSLKNEISSSSCLATTSQRKTSSVISSCSKTASNFQTAYYLRVFNHGIANQEFHLYEYNGNNSAYFENADPFYTVTSPALADHAFAVGAYVNSNSWQSYNGDIFDFDGIDNTIAPFSGCGPRIDGYAKPDISAPGSAIISLRDHDVYKTPDVYWVSNDGLSSASDYYVMQGTSMASPVAAGTAALIKSRFPKATNEEIYSAIKGNSLYDKYTGGLPNNSFGNGKIDAGQAVSDLMLTSKYSDITNKYKTNSAENSGLSIFPNPFTNSANISFQLDKDSYINVSLFDLLGKKAITIFEGYKTSGHHTFVLNPDLANGCLSSGVYICRLKTSSETNVKKVIMVK
jgi:subtilisin family serine protease